MLTVRFKQDILPSSSSRLWFLCPPSSPDDLASHLSLLLWVRKHIPRHRREAQVLWLCGWGFYEADFQTSSTPIFTKPQTDHHITETLLWCDVVTSCMASQTPPPYTHTHLPVQSWFPRPWTVHCRTWLSGSSGLCIQCISIFSCCWCSAQREGVVVGGWGRVLMVVISSGLKTRVVRQFGWPAPAVRPN